MIISKKEIANLKAIVDDIDSGLLPNSLLFPVLLGFFTQNPHLLMSKAFDEHLQEAVSEPDQLLLASA